MKQTENEMNVNVPLEVIKASEIEPKEVKWLWYPYIPLGKVTLLQGDPGDGKSKLMLSIAALLSKGEPLPFTETEETEPMTIIYQTTEDDADDTVVPRFNSAGGNGENLIFIKEDEKSLSFGDNRIAEAIERYHAKLLILDPMSSYIGENCSMNNANETRAEFNHLIAVAKNTGCAIVIIAHMNKMRDTNPLYRTVPFPVSWTVKMKKKQKETQDILSYHSQAAGCSDKARAKASGGRQPIEECGRTGL